MNLQGPAINVESGLTIRAFIVTWVLDLEAIDKDGTINTISPVTLGVVETTNDTDSFDPPPYGPHQAPDYPWRWWDGGYFNNDYGYTTGTTTGAAVAHGKIIREAPFILGDEETPWAALWLSLEIEDVDTYWSSFRAQAWFQVLTAPVVG